MCHLKILLHTPNSIWIRNKYYMPDESKIRRDRNTGYPKYDKFEDYNDGLTH